MNRKMDREGHQSLAGRSALITGGARNIGLAIAKEMASRGVTVAIADSCHDLETVPYALASADQLARAVDELTRLEGRAIGMLCDVRDEGQVQETVDRVIQEFGHLDILVNNAGVGSLYPIQELTEKAWNEVVDVCLKGTFLCSKFAVPPMIRQRTGRIINIASVAGLRGLGFSAHYCAAKHGVIGLTRALAVELADHGIQVLAVCPGTVESPSLQGLASQVGLEVNPYEHFSQRHLLKDRRITPRDIAEAVCWLASGECRCLTGTILTVDAGWTAQ
ncbi:MAG: SDR family oxidoreductase [Deltaproteobacteria bacterium]|nr:SDR family oxidoreductase [Deltaproteobacteria bacterium]